MKYLDEYRNEGLAQKVVSESRRVVTKPWVLTEVCRGQTLTIVKYGIDHPISFRGGTCARAWLPRMRHLAGDDRAGLKVDEPSEVK